LFKIIMERVVNALFGSWKNQHAIIKEDDEGNKYIWPQMDHFSFEHQIKTYKPVIEEVSSFCKNFGNVLQAGGNCGIYTREYAKKFKTVFTFEPDMTNMMCLNMNTLTYGNILKFHACLGEHHCITSIQNPLELLDTGGIHVKTENVENIPGCMPTVESKKIIPILKIDDFSLEDLDLIHLDIEGYELNALKGGVETIKRCKPIIVLEIVDEHLKRFNCSRQDVFDFMASIDYKFVKQLDSNNDFLFQPNSV